MIWGANVDEVRYAMDSVELGLQAVNLFAFLYTRNFLRSLNSFNCSKFIIQNPNLNWVKSKKRLSNHMYIEIRKKSSFSIECSTLKTNSHSRPHSTRVILTDIKNLWFVYCFNLNNQRSSHYYLIWCFVAIGNTLLMIFHVHEDGQMWAVGCWLLVAGSNE